MKSIYVLCALGLLLSIYSLFTLSQKKRKTEYKSFCDINEKASCTKAFSSKYGSHFGVPNGVWGILFYITLGVSNYLEQTLALVTFSSFGLISSFYLAYVLVSKVKTWCVVCITIYGINLGLFLWIFLEMY